MLISNSPFFDDDDWDPNDVESEIVSLVVQYALEFEADKRSLCKRQPPPALDFAELLHDSDSDHDGKSYRTHKESTSDRPKRHRGTKSAPTSPLGSPRPSLTFGWQAPAHTEQSDSATRKGTIGEHKKRTKDTTDAEIGESFLHDLVSRAWSLITCLQPRLLLYHRGQRLFGSTKVRTKEASISVATIPIIQSKTWLLMQRICVRR